jgi:hypothetical protein
VYYLNKRELNKKQEDILNSARITAGLLFLLLCTESILSEDTPLPEDTLSFEKFFADEQLFPDKEFSLSDESLPNEDSLLSENFPDESLIFEAPPLVFEVPRFVYVPRSFDELFPGLSQRQKRMVSSSEGLKRTFEKDGSPTLIPNPASGIDLLNIVMQKNPSHIVEALVLVPYNERELDILDTYNALGRIKDIKDYPLTINNRVINIFEESTRLESARNRRPAADPPPADTLPYAETIYLRLKDTFYGNLYIRGDISMSLYGITYSMTNFTDVRYFLIPVIRAERISINIYLEPVKEGVLIYSMSGLYIPGFIADRVNLTPNINIRITVLISWITDGLRKQESIVRKRENEM